MCDSEILVYVPENQNNNNDGNYLWENEFCISENVVIEEVNIQDNSSFSGLTQPLSPRNITQLNSEIELEQSVVDSEQLPPKKTRKRKRNPELWKSSIRKKKCQSGEEYVSARGKFKPSRKIINKKDCLRSCKYSCSQKISNLERQDQFNAYYRLDMQRKRDFILKTTARNLTERKTTKKDQSRRTFSFCYYIDVAGIRHVVCKKFYTGTFNISQTPVYTAHQNKCSQTGTAQIDMRGRKKVKKIPQEKIDKIIAHINSFPRIDSHYCRAKTSRQYLEPNLNITKMYELYSECTSDPVKESFYRNILCTRFDIDFQHPKSDRCGACEKYKIADRENLMTDVMSAEKENHYTLKLEMRESKACDKQSGIPILSFDLQNVLNCPRANIGPMFYFSKLNIYNLTAHLSSTRKTYCCVWTEYTSGRSGNDLASALVKILNRVFEDNSDIIDLITWSDSCVPQNKNTIMSTAILSVINHHPQINSICMKYSVAGHGAIQEVDNIHSSIEKVLPVNEYFSPMGLIRLLKTVNRRNPLIIMQMNATDFMDFGSFGKMVFDFSKVPFTKLKLLKFTRQQYQIQYSLGYKQSELITQSIRRTERNTKKSDIALLTTELLPLKKKAELSDTKKQHIQAMFQYMSPSDINYYKVILKLDGPDELNISTTPTTSQLKAVAPNKRPKNRKQNAKMYCT